MWDGTGDVPTLSCALTIGCSAITGQLMSKRWTCSDQNNAQNDQRRIGICFGVFVLQLGLECG